MSALASYWEYRKLRRSQWLDPDRIRELQSQKLRQLCEHAYRHVQFYRRRFDSAGIKPGDIRSLADLPRLPITLKRHLLDAGSGAITSRAFDAGEFVSRRTTGSTGEPFTLRFDRNWVAVQQALFLRALNTAGWRIGRRLMLISEAEDRRRSLWTRWSYVPHELSAPQVLDRVRTLRPEVLYGWVTPLRRLAMHMRDEGVGFHGLRSVITTAETLDAPTRALLGDVFAAEVFEFYGLTEMGIVAGECSAHDGLHLAEDAVIVECLPEEMGGAGGRLVMTNLHLLATPMLRYQTGDLGEVDSRPCPCGRSSARLKRIEGRLVDCVRLRDGRVISPYRLTLAIEPVPGVRRYRVIQDSYDKFSVEIEHSGTNSDLTEESVRRAVKGVVGREVKVRIVRRARLDPPPGEKFRVVESRVRPMEADSCAS